MNIVCGAICRQLVCDAVKEQKGKGKTKIFVIFYSFTAMMEISIKNHTWVLFCKTTTVLIDNYF